MPEKRILPERGVVEVTFTMPAEVGAGRIELVGDFTNWNAVDMKRQQDGGWALTLELPPGRRYEYRYRIDEARWENDWRADEYVANQHGQDNSVVVTPPLDASNLDGTSSPAASSSAAAQKAGTAKAPAKKAAAAKKARGTASPAKTTEAKKAPGKKAAAKKAPAKRASVSKPAVTKAAGGRKSAGAEQPAAKKAAPGKSAAKKTVADPSSPDA